MDFKYILQWNCVDNYLGTRQNVFNNCEYTNCYVTTDRRYFDDNTTLFDAIIFEAKGLQKNAKDLPKVRSQTQKYIFASIESAHYYPVCNPQFDGFFNWTWTYRLDSDLRWGYITGYDSLGRPVAPKPNMHWEKFNSTPSMKLDQDLKRKLSNKNKAAAWLVSNCNTESKREIFAKRLIKSLNARGLDVSVYGRCGKLRCCRNCESCIKQLRNHYFYFAFENSFAKDYVTEKVMTAINNFMVPVVYGRANYSRFLPPGSYLNGKELGVTELAKTMEEIILDPPRYRSFFSWTPYYNYKETTFTQDICNLCAMLNNIRKVHKVSVRKHFTKWWNRDGQCPKPRQKNMSSSSIRPYTSIAGHRP